MVVWADGGKHCFACHLHVPPPWKFPTKPKETNAYPKTALPTDFQREVPARAWKWLLQYGVPYSYWQTYCGYSPAEERLIFCVPNIERVQFSVGRFIEPDGNGPGEEVFPQPRLLPGVLGSQERPASMGGAGLPAGRRPAKWFAYGDCHKGAHVYGDYREAQEIVLVEDLISAHKVGVVGAAIPLFGTRVFDSVVSAIRHIKLPVVFWLDSDQKNGIQKKAAHLSMLTNLPVRYVFTEKDPKLITFDGIKEILK